MTVAAHQYLGGWEVCADTLQYALENHGVFRTRGSLARAQQPGIEANRSCSGVEFIVGKDLLALTSGAIKNPHCTKHLRYFLPFLCKIQAKAFDMFQSVVEYHVPKRQSE